MCWVNVSGSPGWWSSSSTTTLDVLNGRVSSVPGMRVYSSCPGPGLLLAAPGPPAVWGSLSTLTHRGVLFLDELGEFDPTVLDSLRQPLEEGVIRVARAAAKVTFPA